MEAIRRGLGEDGVVCLDELTSLATGLGCLVVCAVAARGAASRVSIVRMTARKGVV
jgi:hypothetical protein